MTQKQKKRIGRPPLPAKARKAVNLTFRVRRDMREWLRTAAAESGRSISEEIESILEAHRAGQDIVARALGGPHALPLIRPLLLFIDQLGRIAPEWTNDRRLLPAVARCVGFIAEATITKKRLSYEECMKWASPSMAMHLIDDKRAPLLYVTAVAILQLFGFAEPAPRHESLQEK